MTKRTTPTDMTVGRLLGCEPQRSPRSIPATHCIALCCGSKPVLAEAGSGLTTAKIASAVARLLPWHRGYASNTLLVCKIIGRVLINPALWTEWHSIGHFPIRC